MDDQNFKKQFKQMMARDLVDVPSFDESWEAAGKKLRRPKRFKIRLAAAAAIILVGTFSLLIWVNQNSAKIDANADNNLEKWQSPTNQFLAGNLKTVSSNQLLNWQSPTASLMKPLSVNSKTILKVNGQK